MQSTQVLPASGDETVFHRDRDVQIRLLDVSIERCVHSRFNTRKTRDASQVQQLADRIARNGFERTRSLWAVEGDGQYEVFAGGTRLEAAKIVGLKTVPVFVHEGLSDEDISRKADEDNENDEYHIPVSLLDVWAECHRLWKEEGWTQQQIADAKGWQRTTVARRTGWHVNLPQAGKQAVCDGILDEGHLEPISSVVCDVAHFTLWLTAEQAQTELVAEVLSKHRGSSAGVKPTVKTVREAAKRWKSLIQAAETAYLSLPEGPWREKFVDALARDKARSEAAISRALGSVVAHKRREEEDQATRLRVEADSRTKEAERLKQEEAKLQFLESQTAKLCLGDARELIHDSPVDFALLLADPPYGMEFQSNRRVTSVKKPKLAGDEKQQSLDLLRDVLTAAYPRMAEDATCLIFTGWRWEPEFRQVVEAAGFAIKGSLVWVKNNHGTGDLAGSFAPKHERIIHAVKGKPKLQKRVADVLSGHDKQDSRHPTEKPRDLLCQLIEATTAPGDTVVDPFAGSGNTLLEAYRMSRDFWGAELDPDWHRGAVELIHKMAEEDFAHGCLDNG